MIGDILNTANLVLQPMDINWDMQNLMNLVLDIYSNLDWGSIQYSEFSSTSYTDINWGYAELMNLVLIFIPT